MEEGEDKKENDENNYVCARTPLDFGARCCCKNAQIRG